VHIGVASLTLWFNSALTLDAPSGTHLVWAPSTTCASGAASCFVASSDLRATGASSAAVPVSFTGDVGALVGSSAAVTAFTADAGCAAADLVGGAGCSIAVPAALVSASAVGFESATQGAAAVTASVSHASVTWSVRPPIRLTSPQTVFTGITLNNLVSTTVTINNFPASAPVSVWVDGLGVRDLLVSATPDFVALTTAVCAGVSDVFNGTGNACFGVLPSRFAPPGDLNLALVPQANDRPAADLHLLGFDVFVDAAHQVRRIGRAGGSVDLGPNSPRMRVDRADEVLLFAAGRGHVHRVHLEEFPDPGRIGADPALAVAVLLLALALALALLHLRVAYSLDLAACQELLHDAADGGLRDLPASLLQGSADLLDAPGEALAHLQDRRPKLRRPHGPCRRRLAQTRAVHEAGRITLVQAIPAVQRRLRIARGLRGLRRRQALLRVAEPLDRVQPLRHLRMVSKTHKAWCRSAAVSAPRERDIPRLALPLFMMAVLNRGRKSVILWAGG